MDIGNLKKHADLTFKVVQAKKNALERLNSRQLMAYNGRLFRADANTINIVSTLKQHMHEFYVLDVNDNPCHITDPVNFLRKLIERNQETLNAYQQLHQDLANKRI
jgi:ribosome biogenesis protein Tsr3